MEGEGAKLVKLGSRRNIPSSARLRNQSPCPAKIDHEKSREKQWSARTEAACDFLLKTRRASGLGRIFTEEHTDHHGVNYLSLEKGGSKKGGNVIEVYRSCVDLYG